MEIKSLITESEYDSEMSSPNLKGAESYLDEEEQLLSYIQDLLSKNFDVRLKFYIDILFFTFFYANDLFIYFFNLLFKLQFLNTLRMCKYICNNYNTFFFV